MKQVSPQALQWFQEARFGMFIHWGLAARAAGRRPRAFQAGRLVHLLARSASVGANLLLNVGPTAEGEILPVQGKRLRGVGAWLKVNGESIYGTHGGVIPPVAEGPVVSTRRGPTHYLHSLDDVSDCIRLHETPNYVTRATLLKDGSPVKPSRQPWPHAPAILRLAWFPALQRTRAAPALCRTAG